MIPRRLFGRVASALRSFAERILGAKLGKEGKIAIAGEQDIRAVGQAQGCDAGVVHNRASHAGALQ